ncbi:hypothetical protein PENTCL1PPCAC_18645 [Pristionchus entomophagus]|uniref:Uncharacterized protein n=1 Tax=Pristionchus entomophagus TaxID=358040 RepID=A0AAV5TPU3_9BILA|nr:hypothetical protein PENTCL1PPCAC_18645 [Pristionchus entomophagus]
MDVDLESVEIVFAQRLASGEPVVRAHALRELHKWIKSQSAKKPFGEEDLMRLCKGLHYVMWMQDKMLNQEELADNISGLLNVFESEDEKALYVQCFFAALSKEWQVIDRWRMDKFLMLIRRLVRTAFLHLASLKWKKSVTEKYWKAFKATVMSNDRTFRDSLKFHFASIFLDELDNAGNITTERVTDLVGTFAEMLTIDISDYIFSSVIEEIFTTILHAMSDEMEGDEEEEEEEGEGEEDEEGEEEAGAAEEKEGIKFDYSSIGAMLFDVGKKESVKTKRRARLYDLAKKFELAAKGEDPFAMPEVSKKEPISGRDFFNAVQRAMSQNLKTRKGKEVGKKTRKALRKLPAETDLSNGMAGLIDLDSFKPSEKKYKGDGAAPERKQTSGKAGKRKITSKVSSGGSINKRKRAQGIATGSAKASAKGAGKRKVSKRPKTKSGKAKAGH